MSIRTWCEEFYTKEVYEVKTPIECLERDLLKWTGLLPKSLRKHEVAVRNGILYSRDVALYGSENEEDYEYSIKINGNTCSLCHAYAKEDCKECPIKIHGLGESPDGEACSYEFTSFVFTNDPRLMIKLLRETLEKEKWNANKD